jgi:acyl-CoA thioester hydrolase
VSAEFRHRLRIRYHECDPQGVVFNANYLAFFDMTITEWWREAFGGYQAMVDGGVDMVVAEASVRYLRPLRFDEEIEVIARPAELGTTSLTTELTIERDGETAAEGSLRHVFVDTAAGSKIPIPERIRDVLAA